MYLYQQATRKDTQISEKGKQRNQLNLSPNVFHLPISRKLIPQFDPSDGSE